MMESLRLVERGDATKEDVDVAMKLGAGYREYKMRAAHYIYIWLTPWN